MAHLLKLAGAAEALLTRLARACARHHIFLLHRAMLEQSGPAHPTALSTWPARAAEQMAELQILHAGRFLQHILAGRPPALPPCHRACREAGLRCISCPDTDQS